MLLTPHILTGAAIAVKFQNPALGIFLAYSSHYFLDAIPHKEYSVDNIKERRWKKSLADFAKVSLDAGAAFLVIFLIAGDNPIAYFGAAAAIMPDGLTLLYAVFPKSKLAKIHHYYHNRINEIGEKIKSSLLGILSQMAVAAAAIYFLL